MNCRQMRLQVVKLNKGIEEVNKYEIMMVQDREGDTWIHLNKILQ